MLDKSQLTFIFFINYYFVMVWWIWNSPTKITIFSHLQASSVADNTSNPTMVNPTNPNVPANDTSQLIQFNHASQLPKKYTRPTNFFNWIAQVASLMYDHDLMPFLDGTIEPQSQTITVKTKLSPTQYKLCFRQDQLILNALLASV